MKICAMAPRAALGLAIAAAIAAPAVRAETNTQTGNGTLSAPVHLDFSIVIPRFLTFRVGTAGATIDLITFTVPVASVGNSTPIAGTGGDLGGGVATVNVQGNGGQITITETNNSAGAGLTNGLGDAIPYSQITTTSSDATNLAAPVLSNGSSNTAQPVLNGGRVTNRSATWTYAYANTTIPGAGTYGGVNTQGGRVTYTAAMP
jgi:hypothetical protein